MRRLENTADVDRFRTLIHARLGLNFDETRMYFLAEVIQSRLDDTRLSAGDYLHRLEFDGAHGELTSLAAKLTVPETYFFRNREQFAALREIALPQRMEAQRDTRTLKLLSAGCATGEEPYSLAMTLMAAGLDSSWKWSVRAIDVNPVVLKRAKRGRYTTWALRETDPVDQKRWFTQDEREFVLNEAVRAAVTFQECNLTVENYEIWEPQSYDIIFCRNVLMYFSTEKARQVVARIAQSLKPGGFLFLGHAETLRGLSDDFHLRHTHEAFYYQRKLPGEPTSSAYDILSSNSVPPISPPALSEDWIQSIHRASARVHALSTDTVKTEPSGVAAAPSLRKAPDMTPVFAMIHSDRFSDALAYLQDLPTDVENDPDVLLVRAMLLAIT